MFEALAAVDRLDGDWLDRQPEENRKGFAAPVFLRWASAIDGGDFAQEYTISLVNDRVNLYANELMSKYPDLLFRLAASCGVGDRQRHVWLPLAKRKGPSVHSGNAAWQLVAEFNPSASEAEIDLLMGLHTADSFRAFAEDAGLQQDSSKEVLKAYDNLAAKTKNAAAPNAAGKAKTKK
jgi:hypothetical protein